MAQLQSTGITGSLSLKQTTSNTGTCGYLWFDTASNNLKYSYFNGAVIATCTFVGTVASPPYTGV